MSTPVGHVKALRCGIETTLSFFSVFVIRKIVSLWEVLVSVLSSFLFQGIVPCARGKPWILIAAVHPAVHPHIMSSFLIDC